MNIDKSNLNVIQAKLENQFNTSEAESKYLLRFLELNLMEINHAFDIAAQKSDWEKLEFLNLKLESLSLNLKWPTVLQFVDNLTVIIEKRDKNRLDSLIKKLPSIIDSVF